MILLSGSFGKHIDSHVDFKIDLVSILLFDLFNYTSVRFVRYA